MEIYLVRHGETDWNVQKRLQGREDVPMNATGEAQANTAGKALSGISFDYILSSPLSRACRTAEIIDGYVRCGKVVCEDGLTERCFGSLSGQQVKNLYTAEADDMEPQEDVCDRVMSVLCRYERLGFSRILAVSHGGTIRALFRGTGQGLSEPMVLKNACINICDLSDGRLSIKGFNMTAEDFEMMRSGE